MYKYEKKFNLDGTLDVDMYDDYKKALSEDLSTSYKEDFEFFGEDYSFAPKLKNCFFDLTSRKDGIIRIETKEVLSDEEIEKLNKKLLTTMADGLCDYVAQVYGERFVDGEYVETIHVEWDNVLWRGEEDTPIIDTSHI